MYPYLSIRLPTYVLHPPNSNLRMKMMTKDGIWRVPYFNP